MTSPRHLIVTIAGVAMFGLLLGYLVAVLFVFPPHNVAADLRRVPDLVGRTVEEARRRTEREDLALEEALAIHHAQPLGTVVAQEPLAGQMARPGSVLRVTTSLGPPERPVPDVVGLSREQAEMILLQAGFEVEVTRLDASADVGQVVGVRPAPGTPVVLPGEVRLLVSAGASSVQIPDLAMQSVTEAEATLRRLGLRLGEVLEDSASLAAPGTVLGQSPVAGESAARGASVSVTVAVAPLPAVDSTTLPDTGGVEPDTARA
ncbi:MAG: PASTA domain-containing protein [Gemmatimonadetes bacterium]|nr:PASTA domain-containing protein [Gemmatimonadota bacterium]NIO31581.1 PASTA domain-containing protein [Gemmatimonadota bacterium]